jgi:hypothetical protein
VEARARELTGDGDGRPKSVAGTRSVVSPTGAPNTDPAVRRIEEQLRKHMQTDVHIQQLGNERGVVRISYYSTDDLERVLDLVLGKRHSDFD